jgi:hypothetical protein
MNPAPIFKGARTQMAKRKEEEGPRKFGVFQKKAGSYTLADNRFTPLMAVPVSVEDAELACEEESPVKFYDTKEAADEAIGKLKAKFDSQPKNQ